MFFGKPLLDFFVAPEALRVVEPIFQGGHHIGRYRFLTGLQSGIFDLLDLLDASFFVEVEPVGNRMAMDAQLPGCRASTFGLPGLQEKKHLEAALDPGVFLLANKPLKPLG
jgi:hypothetical protein